MISFRERMVIFIKKIPGSDLLKKIPFVMNLNASMREKYMDNRREKVQIHGYEIINIVYEIAQELGIPIWLDWGTLLGYVRESAIIEHDYDLDFAAWRMEKELYASFRKKMKDNGFSLVREFCRKDLIITETYEYKEILVDFDYYDGDSTYAWTYSFDTSDESIIKIIDGVQQIKGMDVFKFEVTDLNIEETQYSNGIKCFVPEYAERRVAEEYGENWRTPIKNHNWKELNNYLLEGFDSAMTGWRKK